MCIIRWGGLTRWGWFVVHHSMQAMNKALKWLEAKGFKAERVNTGKFGATKGKAVSMTTADGKTGFRIEYDDRSGAHINVFSGKDKGDHYQFDAIEKTTTKHQKDITTLQNQGEENDT
ncbi:hypothetical protein D3C81_1680190 [compost metagenome]|jgi:hypothetical protein